ncbi:hypothetical protein [Streptomyces sp. NPDC093071]|uniref:hypothetical protein n=1 Tax=Streptomyces sp. NPDC093071 TaxID=3366022 RepID=UPI0037F4CCF0
MSPRGEIDHTAEDAPTDVTALQDDAEPPSWVVADLAGVTSTDSGGVNAFAHPYPTAEQDGPRITGTRRPPDASRA